MSTEKLYSSNKKSMIFLGNKNKVVSFMPFLSNLSYTKKANVTENKQYWGDLNLTNGTEMNYKLTFNVVSDSRDTARKHHKKFSTLARMVVPLKKQTTKSSKNVCQLYVKFSNLIHNAKPNNYSDSFYENFDNLKKEGILCNISSLNYKPDLDMGFFEYKGLLFAKSFEIDLDLEVVAANSIYKKYKKGSPLREVSSKSPGRMFGFDVI